MWSLSAWRRRRTLARHPIDPQLWQQVRERLPILDGISDADIAGLNIPTGIPLVYTLDDTFQPVTKGGEYLDPEAAKEAIQAVANQGKK